MNNAQIDITDGYMNAEIGAEVAYAVSTAQLEF